MPDINPGYYVATVKLVDASDITNVLAVDKVTVTGEYNYTVPEYIYQQKQNGGTTEYLEYKIAAGENLVINLKPATGGDQTVYVKYDKQNTAKEQRVTFNFIDASKRVNETGRNVGKDDTQFASATNPTVKPPDTITAADGKTTLYIMHNADQYAYQFGKGENPVKNVLYAPAGYVPPKETVTVNYVNLANNTILKSETHVLDSKTDDSLLTDNAKIDFATSFTQNGEQYVLVNPENQTPPISHPFGGGDATYTIYYRNVNDNLHVDTYVTHITVVYNDTVVDDGEGEGTAATPLPANETLNSITTPNGGLVTNNAGVDSETIREDGTPLAQNPNDQFSIQKDWPLVVGGLGIAALAALIIALLLRKRNDSDDAK